MTTFKFTAFRSLGLISGLCLGLLTPSIASAVLIDNFTNTLSPSNPLTRTVLAGIGTTVGVLEPNLSGVINSGDRLASVSIVTGTTTAITSRAVRLDIQSGLLALSTDSGVRGKFTLDYSDIGAVNASAVGQALLFNITDNVGGGVFDLTLSDGMNTSSTPLTVLSGQTGPIAILINALTFPTVNRAAVTSFNLMYTIASTGGSLEITGGLDLTTVPEPSSLAIALTGLGLAGVYFRRRRKQLIA